MPESFFKIGEIAKLYNIGTDSIRYYETLGLISPLRGKNGYRLYSINEIWRMNVIRDLRSIGFSMEHIGDYLNNRSVENTSHLLQEALDEIEQQMAGLNRLKQNVENRLNSLYEVQNKTLGIVEESFFPRRPCHEIFKPFTQDAQMDLLLKTLLNQIQNRLYIIGNTQIGCRMDGAGPHRGDFHSYESVFIVDEAGEETNSFISQGRYLTLNYRGNTRQNARYVPMLFDYAKAHGLTLAGGVIELVLIDIHEASSYKEHMTQLQIQVLP